MKKSETHMPDTDNKSTVQAVFGAHASMYTTSTVHAQGDSLARLVALAAPMADDIVLDIATGAGHNALSFAPHVRYTIGTDLTAPMLTEASALAQRRGINNVSFCQSDVEHLPFAANSFAVVTCRIAPHHFPDVAGAVREMARVCRVGGCVAIADNITPEDTAAAAYINAFEQLRDPSHNWAYTLQQWREFFAQAGLALEAEEILAKAMNFVAWTERLSVAEDVVEELRQLLFNAPALPLAYFRPRVENQDIYFDLTEAVFMARKVA
jgi:ubiquinone/menaquinone biosynthesis C-methylase UbiE